MTVLTTFRMQILIGVSASWLVIAPIASVVAQTTEPELIIQAIQYNSPDTDGFFTAFVNITLRQPIGGGSNVSFTIRIPHVKQTEDLKPRIKSIVDQLVDAIKKASEHFEPHQ